LQKPTAAGCRPAEASLLADGGLNPAARPATAGREADLWLKKALKPPLLRFSGNE